MISIQKLLFAILFTIFSANASAIENGVSHTLAQHRAAMISGVKYQLSFIIPQEKTQKVRCQETITFDAKDKEDLVLDFQGDNSQFDGRCKVNGKRVNADFHDEHIVIPRKYLRRGSNEICLNVISGDKSLNRNADYLYTLFVPDHARSVFACFDQPDLKATFLLTLDMPSDWKAMSNGAVSDEKFTATDAQSRRKITFCESDTLPTYLFTFTAGKFQYKKAERDGRQVECLYRETDDAKVAQLDIVFDEIAHSLKWLESYTGIPQPFSKYGFVVLPGYQFGGMEHPGAIQYRDQSIFLGKNPTPDEELRRMDLIAHETSHLWFGDLVTMRWFDDVWTKEVFANYLASKITREKFPNINHELNFIKAYYPRAISTDRTDGTHPIQQSLDNLNRAGLLYGNIVYDKSPVMMRNLETLIGETAFRDGLREYLQTYCFANATWDDLVKILDRHNPKAGVEQFSHSWVKEKGLPTITTQCTPQSVIIRQHDPYGRGLVWKQRFSIGLLFIDTTATNGFRIQEVPVEMTDSVVTLPLESVPEGILANYDGRGYGRFSLPADDIMTLLVAHLLPETNRFAAMMNIYEDCLMREIDDKHTLESLFRCLHHETNPLIASTCIDYISTVCRNASKRERKDTELGLMFWALADTVPSVRQKIIRVLSSYAINDEVNELLYALWADDDDHTDTDNEPAIASLRTLLNERDFINMAYHLAIAMPNRWQQIISTQRGRIKDADRQREFDFVSRACNPDTTIQQQLFNSLLQRENRYVEPWAAKMLMLLNDDSREQQSCAYLTPALEALEEIQRTGDIFFPGDWLYSLLSGHHSQEAQTKVRQFIDSHQNLQLPLMNKLKENAYLLLEESADEK